jgi:phage terminase large subunit-like protein
MPRRPTKDYAAIARQYCEDVLSNKILACNFVKQACDRQLKDLARTDWQYRFDSRLANRACAFIERCPHIKGRQFAGKRLILEPWQVFIVTTVFGWVNEHGNRRFRRVYLELPKGSGKSALTSAIALYMLVLDGEPGAEIYSAATTRDQAKIVFGVAQAMARKMPEFCAKYGVEVGSNAIFQQSANSSFKALSREANSLEGINPHFVAVDELHAHDSRDVYDNVETACNKRSQSLLWAITTAGSNRSGICYEVRGYLLKILSGVVLDETVFGLVYTIDESDDWADESTWRKANPNWGVSVDPVSLAGDARKAMQLASAQPAFKTKHLNVWVNADSAWMDMRKWERCADQTLTEEDFAGKSVITGLDLGSKLDLIALIKLFWDDREEEINGETRTRRHYFAFGTYWTPDAVCQRSENSQYAGWEIEGRLRTCPGETNDYDMVEDELRDIGSKYQLVECAHDPWQAQQLVNHLQAEGVLMVEIPQLPRHLSEPMKELEAAVYDGRFHFDGDPILTWAISNVVCHRDKNDNLFPTKERPENKIDPATALLTALNRVMAQSGTQNAGFEILGII